MNNQAANPPPAANFLLKGAEPGSVSGTYYCAFSGPSMRPTLGSEDLLIVSCYAERPPRIGDVVMFTTADPDYPVVHRIIGRRQDRFRTRGDNCSIADPRPLARHEILGRVTGAVRGVRQRRITGGAAGMLLHLFCRLRRICLPLPAWPGKTLRVMAGSCSLSIPMHSLRIIRLTGKTTTRHRLMLGSRIVGNYDPERRCWIIKRLYRPFIDRKRLPNHASP